MGSSAPQRADGDGADAVAEIERSWPGVQDEAGGESVLQPVAQPRQVSGVVACRRCGGFDLDCDDAAAAELGEHVNLVAAMFFAYVVQAGSAPGDGQLGSQLAGDEGIEEPAEEVAVASYPGVAGTSYYLVPLLLAVGFAGSGSSPFTVKANIDGPFRRKEETAVSLSVQAIEYTILGTNDEKSKEPEPEPEPVPEPTPDVGVPPGLEGEGEVASSVSGGGSGSAVLTADEDVPSYTVTVSWNGGALVQARW